MTWTRWLRESRTDCLIAVALTIGTFLLLLPGLGGPGVTWDEAAPNIPAAKNQAAWFAGLSTLDAPFSKATIDEYWETPSDHPSFPRMLAAFSLLLFGGIVDELVALRIPSAIWFSLLVGLLFVFLGAHLSRSAALAGALSLVLMPRVFGHAHLYSLDLPIMVMWFVAAVSGYAVLRGWLHPVWFGVMYAIAFSTKLHAVFLPAPLLMWAVGLMLFDREQAAVYARRLGWAVGLAFVLLPVIYVGLQPWLWHDTGTRIAERFFDYSRKASTNPIPLFYLGTIYGANTPWHYPLVMLAFTIPGALLVMLVAGTGTAVRSLFCVCWKKVPMQANDMLSAFLLLCMATPLMLVLLPLAQAYDGVRLFLPCFAFVACLIGVGFHTLVHLLSGRVPRHVVTGVLVVVMSVPSLVTYSWLHPHYLAYYNGVIGGVSGAHAAGMETTYWCDSITREFLQTINEVAPPNARLRPHSMQFAALDYYQERSWLREDILRPVEPPYTLHLMQMRQGMFRVPEWTLYLRREPLAVVEVDGVVLAALYGAINDEGRVRVD